MTPLSNLATKLHELTGHAGPGYRKCYNLVLDGRLPTIRQNGRWFVQDADLPRVASVLGLKMNDQRAA